MIPLPASSQSLFSLLNEGAIGLAVTLALFDSGGGWERDQPPAGRRLIGLALPLVVAAAVLAPFVDAMRRGGRWAPPPWSLAAAAALLPLGGLALVWGLAWGEGRPALQRRPWGERAVPAAVIALIITVTVLVFLAEGPRWRLGVVLAMIVGTAGVLGSLLTLTLSALPPRPESRPTITGIPVAILRGSLVVLGLAFADAAVSGLGAAETGPLFLGWLVGGLAIPALALVKVLPRWPRGRWLWLAVLAAAVWGLWSAHQLMFTFPGLVPMVEY